MHSSIVKKVRIAAMLFLVLGVAGSAWAAGVSWQVGDIVVCFGNGQCKVLRNTTGNTLVLLDQISDNGFVGSPGFTYSAGIDNALHVLVADAGTGTQSSIVKYSIASQNFLNNPPNTLAHTIIATFDGSFGTSSGGIKAFSLDSAGHIFVGNSTPATVAEIDQNRPFWSTNTEYPQNFIIIDQFGDLQQVSSPTGTSGTTQPTFMQGQGSQTLNDGMLTWTNIGAASTGMTLPLGVFPVSTAVQPPSAWATGRCYPGNPPCLTGSSITTILDTNGHLQTVLTPGTSGGAQPTWNDAKGTTVDNAVTWKDMGVSPCAICHPHWTANNPYALNIVIIDPHGHLQQVMAAGTSGPSIPSFNDLGGMTTDGLTWTDTGLPAFGTNCVGNQLASLDLGTGNNPAVYFTSGGIVQKVATPLSGSSTCTIVADFGPNVTLSTIKVVPTGATSQNLSSDALLVLAKGTVDLDIGAPTTDPDETSGEDTTDICTNAAPATPTSCALLLNTSTGAIVARYSIPNTNLQALALDPLVANCTSNACANSTTQPAPTVRSGNFWVGDGASDTFYRFAFAGGAPTTFTTTPPCNLCNIQAMAIYGGEGANQPDLALLATGALSPPISTNANTESGTFLKNVITTSLYGPNSNPDLFTGVPANLYASLVDESTCFNDGVYNSVTNTYANNGLPCRQTTPTATAPVNPGIVVKVDVPAGSSTTLPSTETLITGFQTLPLPPGNGNGTEDNSTDVFVDMAFDLTISVGNTDSSGPIHSVHSLHEVPIVASQGQANCTYSTPVPGACYKTNRNTLNFIFTCSGLTANQFQSMQPSLSLKQVLPGQAGRQIFLMGTNAKGPYRFDPAHQFWTFQWNLNGAPAGTYTGTTFDATGVQSFPTTFSLKSSCP